MKYIFMLYATRHAMGMLAKSTCSRSKHEWEAIVEIHKPDKLTRVITKIGRDLWRGASLFRGVQLG